jgi:hypothetical protein
MIKKIHGGGYGMRRREWIRNTAWLAVVVMFFIGLVPRVEAGFSPSAVDPLSQGKGLERGKVQKFLETKMVKDRLEKLGFSSDEIQARLAGMSDEQIHQLALKIDELKVAGDSGLGIIIALLVIAILVIVILQMTGHKVIVK